MEPRARLIAILGTAATAALISATGSFEGRKLDPYRDIGGVWTVCDGDTHNVEMRKYTPAECDARLASNLFSHDADISRCIPMAGVPTNVHAALIDMAFNSGAGTVCGGSIPKKVKAGDYDDACETILQYRFAAKGTIDCSVRSNNCYGVYRRRLFEREWCQGHLTNEQIAKGWQGYVEAEK